jgi:WD40 repeat protein
VNSVDFSTDGNLLVSGGDDKNIFIYNEVKSQTGLKLLKQI